jgi:putative Holliday junction resolvase
LSAILGIDLGARRIGVAVGYPETGQVRPLATVGRGTPRHDADVLARLVREHAATGFVVGLPLDADGSEGPQAAETRAWADDVVARTGLPVAWRDERWTSQDAEMRLGQPPRGRSGGPPSPAARRAYRARVDREAAAAIVQAEVDARRAGGGAR